MLKFLHAADFHLDSAFAGLRPEQAAARRRESRESCRRFADYAARPEIMTGMGRTARMRNATGRKTYTFLKPAGRRR